MNPKVISITSQFYKDVPKITGNENESIRFDFDYFSSISMEAIYVIDFLNRNFNFVANRPFLLGGHNVEEALSLGYDFFPKTIYDPDLPLFAEMHAAIVRRLCNMTASDELNYFSFNFRIKYETGTLMVYQKLKPVFVGGQIRYGICLLSHSEMDTPGHLHVYYNNGSDYDYYSMEERQWRMSTKPLLSDREKKILIMAKQGKTRKEIAKSLCIEIQTLWNYSSFIYKKLNVHSMLQAIISATNRHLIFFPSNNAEKRKKGEKPEYQKERRPITPDKLVQIQAALNERKSINSIAKQEGVNVSEFTIRYHIKQCHLKKPDDINS